MGSGSGATMGSFCYNSALEMVYRRQRNNSGVISGDLGRIGLEKKNKGEGKENGCTRRRYLPA